MGSLMGCQRAVDHALEFGHRARVARPLPDRLAILEQDQRGERTHAIFGGDVGRLVEIDAHQLDGPRTTLHKLFEQRLELLARPAPGCVEINEYHPRCLLGLGSEGLFGRLDHGSSLTWGPRG